MNVIIAGAGRAGAALAARLAEGGHRVTVIDPDRRTFDALPRPRIDSGEITVIEGDGASNDVLEKAGIQEAGLFIAVAEQDVRNGLLAQKAKLIYRVKRVICSVKDEYLSAIYRGAGIETVNPAQMEIEQVMAMLGGV
ncbi:MAG: TrkA family potassium uptake protein [Dehalococcoidia bacterium]|nr:TrkA family potassium uptake protein [Dehalococcoidia bacterium]MSQ34328.1 TrkA family potassium uptake protein [Dehalococcoidia bacterium]